MRSRPEPEPDIRCAVGGKPIAFELGEVVHERFAETTFQRQPLRGRFAEEYAKLPTPIRSQLEQRLGGPPAVSVWFPDGTSPGRWQRAIPAILAVLSQRSDEVVHGQRLPVWKKVLGHASLAMTMRYAHLSSDHLRAEMAKTERPVEPDDGTKEGSRGRGRG